MERFSLEAFMQDIPKPQEGAAPGESSGEAYGGFYRLCAAVKDDFYREWESGGSRQALEIQKRAIIGYEKEKEYFKSRIRSAAERLGGLGESFPPWYPDLISGIYDENWGLAGLSEWFLPEFASSSSAKIIGGSVFFLVNGRMELRPQKIGRERTDQLIKAFLLLSPGERMDKCYHETYLLDGTRVTVFTEPMAKQGQASLIFRRYLIPELSFEEQARRGTIPEAAIPLFRTMVEIGFNVVFMGAVRTAKTTFLSTWQSCEDPGLEGVMVETDPEIPLHRLLPGAPIIQLIADGAELSRISKNLLRSDADYFIMAEARDGIALDTAVRIASKGTKRMKLTFHSRTPSRFPLEAASEIVKAAGGDIRLTMQSVAGSFDFLFHFIQLRDKSKKRLKGIYSMNCSPEGKIDIETVCSYDPAGDCWSFRNGLGPAQTEYARESDPEAFERLTGILAALEAVSPVRGGTSGNDDD